MRQQVKYLFIFMAIASLASCNLRSKKLNEHITLKRKDKIAYGTYVAYENLKYLFPQAEVNVSKVSPADFSSPIYKIGYNLMDDESYEKKSSLYVIIAETFDPDEREYNSLLRFVGQGNHIFISAFRYGKMFSDSLNLDFKRASIHFNFNPDSSFNSISDSLWVQIAHPTVNDSSVYTYPGLSEHHVVDRYDSTYIGILGKDKEKIPDLVRQNYKSGGSILVHTDPMALTNFFLLHKQNKSYYDNLFSYFPENVIDVEWDEYYRYGKEFSALQVILANPSLRAAFWLVLLLFLLIYLFESKRRQRIIPVIKPNRNTSLDFVKTVGRLYYQYHDNKNLGQKMTAHLMDHIRNRYNIPTTVIDHNFVNQLAYKSGYDKEKLNSMIYRAKMINDFHEISDEDLSEFHKQTDEFYKFH